MRVVMRKEDDEDKDGVLTSPSSGANPESYSENIASA